MISFTRREFLKLGGMLAAGASLPGCFASAFADGLEQLARQKVRILWLQGQSCSGCSISLLNSDYPDPVHFLTQMISLVFHQTLSAAQGHLVMETVNRVAEAGSFILVVEGSIPVGMPKACMLADKPFEEVLEPLLGSADYVLAVGNCSAYGGIPSAEGNETGASSVLRFMQQRNIPHARRLVNLPSCPIHPESLIGTAAYLVSRGYPPVDPELLTPNMFFTHSTHDHCPRYHDYDKGVFAEKFGDPGCLFKLGCAGMLTRTECPSRQWNGGANWCVRGGAPCIGCSNPDFARFKRFPLYRHREFQTAAV